jgi:hypothetical protein
LPSNIVVKTTWPTPPVGCASTPVGEECHDVGMSSTSPRDLAVTLRSVPRRLHEAVGDVSTDATSGVTAELNEQIAIAAGLMHSPADPAAIADAIEAVPADAWDEATLSKLRTTALDIGRLLRAAAAAAERDDADSDD